MNSSKKTYVQPSVELLGSIAEKTLAGALPLSDVDEGEDNTAFPPGGPRPDRAARPLPGTGFALTGTLPTVACLSMLCWPRLIGRDQRDHLRPPTCPARLPALPSMPCTP